MWGSPKITECLQDSQCRQLGRRAALYRQGTQAQGGHAACPPPLQQQVSSPKAQTGLLLPYLATSHPPAHARARRLHRKGEKRHRVSAPSPHQGLSRKPDPPGRGGGRRAFFHEVVVTLCPPGWRRRADSSCPRETSTPVPVPREPLLALQQWSQGRSLHPAPAKLQALHQGPLPTRPGQSQRRCQGGQENPLHICGKLTRHTPHTHCPVWTLQRKKETQTCTGSPAVGRAPGGGWGGGNAGVYTHKHRHPPTPFSANANSETTHGSRESRRFGKEHKYTRILYYINTHAGLYKYPCPPVWVSYINTLHMTPPAPPHSPGCRQRRGEERVQTSSPAGNPPPPPTQLCATTQTCQCCSYTPGARASRRA